MAEGISDHLPTIEPPNPAMPSWMPWLAFGLMVLAIFFIVHHHLLPALIAGLVMHLLVHAIARRLISPSFSSHAARWTAILLITLLVLALLTVAYLAMVRLLHGTGHEGLEGLLRLMARVLSDTQAVLPPWAKGWLPEDIDTFKDFSVRWLKEHAMMVGSLGGTIGYGLVYVLIGLVIGAMVSLHTEASDPHQVRPLARALADEISDFSYAFRRIVTAQAWITTVNTTLTACYLMGVLPLFGVHLPLVKTMVLVTFVVGFIPILGNLISNTVITVISLSHSLGVAVASLGYLVVIHKLEYFLNARIVGSHIQSRAWEILITMLAMERVAGVPGVIISPILYAYVKDGLKKRGWV